MRQKLVRRHPHVFGEVAADDAGTVLRNWDAIKRTEPGREAGIFGDVPENLPGPLHARKVQRRAASRGFDLPEVPYDAVRAGSTSSRPPATTATPRSARRGTCSSRPSTSRASSRSTPSSPCAPPAAASAARVERAEQLAAQNGETWTDLDLDGQITYYAQARLETTTD